MFTVNRRFLRSCCVVTGIIAVAALCRGLVRLVQDPVLDKLLNFIRTFLYLGLFAAWGISVQRRVIQRPVRHMLVTVAGLTLFWLILREFKFRFLLDPHALRYAWYGYYLPLLLIPLLALLISVMLGRRSEARLPRWTLLLLLPTAALLLLVLTNDLHQLVFHFPESASVWTEWDYRYGPGYYLIALWGVACALGAFGVMLWKVRRKPLERRSWLPLFPFAVAVLYLILYAAEVPLVRPILGDLAVFDCLVFVGFLESCIQCGLIPSNTRYAELFRASVGTSMQITDDRYTVCFAAGDAEPIPEATMRSAEEKALVLADGTRIRNMPIRGGHVLWTEDISELLRLSEKLEALHETLADQNAFLQYSYRQDKEHKTIEEQNRLYDLLESQTIRQINEINRLTADYAAAGSAEERRSILARIVILGSFIKRQRNFVLTLDATPAVPEAMLAGALAESFHALRLFGVDGGFLVMTGKGWLTGSALTAAYDFFEDVMEAALPGLHYLSVRVSPVSEVLQISVLTDCPPVEAAKLQKYTAMRMSCDEEGTEYVLPLEGGDRG